MWQQVWYKQSPEQLFSWDCTPAACWDKDRGAEWRLPRGSFGQWTACPHPDNEASPARVSRPLTAQPGNVSMAKSLKDGARWLTYIYIYTFVFTFKNIISKKETINNPTRPSWSRRRGTERKKFVKCLRTNELSQAGSSYTIWVVMAWLRCHHLRKRECVFLF